MPSSGVIIIPSSVFLFSYNIIFPIRHYVCARWMRHELFMTRFFFIFILLLLLYWHICRRATFCITQIVKRISSGRPAAAITLYKVYREISKDYFGLILSRFSHLMMMRDIYSRVTLKYFLSSPLFGTRWTQKMKIKKKGRKVVSVWLFSEK